MGRLQITTRTLAALFVGAAAVLALPAVPATSGTSPTVTLPPANAKWDYQIGKPYAPREGVTLVSRDREADPLSEHYTMCYVNAFQTQPGEVRWWKDNHPRLLLKKDGKYVVDGYWGEILFDVRTASKREELAGVVNEWITGCADDGFEAVEPDNLDSWTRSRSLMTKEQAFSYAGLLIEHAHSEGLAIGQKNAAGQTDVGADAGFDFAVAEECGRYRECDAYTDAYGDQVFVIEYRKEDFTFSCNKWADELSIVLRDRKVTAPGSKTYVYRSC
jgi:hypothetical protein